MKPITDVLADEFRDMALLDVGYETQDRVFWNVWFPLGCVSYIAENVIRIIKAGEV